tara:strand:+ start:1746 stop:2042 length:297 start_codon:yes stop_codon:yes gene_type:complete
MSTSVDRVSSPATGFQEPQGPNAVVSSNQHSGNSTMTENTSSGGGNTALAFIVGAVVVVLAVVAYFVFTGGAAPQTKEIDVDVNLPEVSAPAVPSPEG